MTSTRILRHVWRRARTAGFALLFCAAASGSYGQSLNDHRDRLIADWAARNGFGGDVCNGWNALPNSARFVFVWNTHRLWATNLLHDVTKLYSIAGRDGGSCGGIEYNRTFMAMTADLQSRLTDTAVGVGAPVPYWRETHDPACSWEVLFWGGECPHRPFTLQVETTNSGPTGQINFFHPQYVQITRQYFGTKPPSYCGQATFWERRSNVCNGESACTGSGHPDIDCWAYRDTIVFDPRTHAYTRGAVGYPIVDELSFEMDQDYNTAHDSSPMCDNISTTYENNYGYPEWNWMPSACSTPPPPAPGYVGCFTDAEARALPASFGEGHTIESCVSAAAQNGYAYAGLQWYGQCFAGNSVGYSQVDDSECNTPCSANPSQMCGGAWRNSIFTTGQ
jgi:hypothetical protein